MSHFFHLDESFPRTYECEHLQETPANIDQIFYYPGGSTVGGRDGHIIRVMPYEGDSWVGIFAYGALSPNGANGLYTLPDPARLCVVAQGQGYVVQANAPASYETVEAQPILDVRPIVEREIIVFATFTDLVAYGKAGQLWRTERLAWEELKITEVTADHIRGKVWDPQTESYVDFTIDPATGEHQGGMGGKFLSR